MFRTIVNSRRVPYRYADLNLYLNRDLNLNPDLDMDQNLDLDLELDLEQVLDLDLNLGLDLGLDLDLDLGLDLDLELDLGIWIWGRSGMDLRLGGSGRIRPVRFWSGSGSGSGPVRDPVLARLWARIPLLRRSCIGSAIRTP